MDPLTWGFIGTLIGTIVGASTSIVTTILNSKYASKNQSRLEGYKRQEIFREFQRENYFKLQENMHKALRLTSLLHIEDMQNFKDTGKWQQGSLNRENDIDLMHTFRDLSIYIERIQNENVREEIRVLINKISQVCNTSSLSESNRLLNEISFDFKEVMKRLGIELRNNYYNFEVDYK